MTKKNKRTKKQKACNEQSRKGNCNLESENKELKQRITDLESENKELNQRINDLKNELNKYHNATTNQLTPKEDFIISLPILIVLIVVSIAITHISLKNETAELSYILAVFSFIISILTCLYDIFSVVLCKCKFKKEIFIGFALNMKNSISLFITLLLGLLIVIILCYIKNKSNIDVSNSNIICSITLVIYFVDILINKGLLSIKVNY